MAESGPAGTLADIELSEPKHTAISLYVVRPDDTLSQIAKMHDVSTNTILWANDLKNSKDIHPGDTLVILPISGVKHKVAKGETIASIVKKYKGDMAETLAYNNFTDGVKLEVGQEIIVPYGIESVVVPKTITSALRGGSGPALTGYFTSPLRSYKKTQGLHGYNGVDLGAPVGSPVMAAASGVVTVSRTFGYNGGYGLYVVITHPNGAQTLYAHLSAVQVGVGESVAQGQQIGNSGNSGRSTGAHLHFEVRGAANPF
jgi:murein DD-endopeptidase MepM/ murein hydrolase activator NlpD